ncbi:MAG: hypothetical protein ACXVYI_13860 [Mycobacterium sp.]
MTYPQTDPHVEYVAHHWLLLAVPAFLPAIIVVAVILYVALRDRRVGRGPKPLRDVSRPEEPAPRAPDGKPSASHERTEDADQKRD